MLKVNDDIKLRCDVCEKKRNHENRQIPSKYLILILSFNILGFL